jgi:hypothetical protein
MVGSQSIYQEGLVNNATKGQFQKLFLPLSSTMEGDTTNFFYLQANSRRNVICLLPSKRNKAVVMN